jgi:3',5'-nucleoside bisphosphate phosphatase
LIDLHTHTTASDGADPPERLVALAASVPLEALAITDHDTFAGFDAAQPHAAAARLRLVCAVELSCIFEKKTPHLLAYFPNAPAGGAFRDWVAGIVETRRERNRELIARLRAQRIEITLEEVEAAGRTITGRPHFARVLVEKGYATDRQDVFDRLIGESGSAFVDRKGPSFEEAIEAIRRGNGISSLAHPIRLGLAGNPERETALFDRLRQAGLDALEVWHSDHTPAMVKRYRRYAERNSLLMTGGSDYHGGDNKPNARLGGVMTPVSVLDAMCAARA